MIGARRIVGRLNLATRCAAASGLLLALVGSAPPAFAEDSAGTSREDIQSLQRRLTDAGCYNGAIDGAPSAALDAAIKACPDQTPFLRIETGMHTAAIWRLGVDASCRRLATTSDDKTLRLWSLPDGRLERTIRLPIGPGDEGKLYAVALSPDGRRLAAGGWDPLLCEARIAQPFARRSRHGLDPPRRNFSGRDSQHRLLSRRRSRGSRSWRRQRRSRLRLDVGQGVVGRSALCSGHLRFGLRTGRLPGREQRRRTVAPLRTGFCASPSNAADWRARTRTESRSIPPAGASRSASATSGKSRSSTQRLWRRSPKRIPAA